MSYQGDRRTAVARLCIEVPGRASVGFARFSHVRGIVGYREPVEGDPVEVEWDDDMARTAAGGEWRGSGPPAGPRSIEQHPVRSAVPGNNRERAANAAPVPWRMMTGTASDIVLLSIASAVASGA